MTPSEITIKKEFKFTSKCDACNNTGYLEIEVEPDNYITKKCPHHENDETSEID